MHAWPRSFARLVALTPVLAACVEPTQYGGPIPVDQAGTGARLSRMCELAPQSLCGSLAARDERDDDGGAARDGSPEGGGDAAEAGVTAAPVDGGAP